MGEPTAFQIDLMCHALGVRDRANHIHGGPGGNEFRNYFLTHDTDKDWAHLSTLGMAESWKPRVPTCLGESGLYYRVTDAGRRAIEEARQGWEEERRARLAKEVPTTEWSRRRCRGAVPGGFGRCSEVGVNRQDRDFLHRLAQALALVAPGNPADIGAVARHSQQADQLLQRVRRLLRELYWDGHTRPSEDAHAQLEALEALALARRSA